MVLLGLGDGEKAMRAVNTLEFTLVSENRIIINFHLEHNTGIFALVGKVRATSIEITLVSNAP